MYLTHIFFRYLKIDHFVNSIIGFNFDEEEKNEDSNPKKLDNGRLKGSSSWRSLSTNKTSPSHGKSSEEKNKKPRNNKKSGDFTRATTKRTILLCWLFMASNKIVCKQNFHNNALINYF